MTVADRPLTGRQAADLYADLQAKKIEERERLQELELVRNLIVERIRNASKGCMTIGELIAETHVPADDVIQAIARMLSHDQLVADGANLCLRGGKLEQQAEQVQAAQR
jgi:hypothetical protein